MDTKPGTPIGRFTLWTILALAAIVIIALVLAFGRSGTGRGQPPEPDPAPNISRSLTSPPAAG